MQERRPTRPIFLGDDRTGIVQIGGGKPDSRGRDSAPAPVSVQTMTAGYTHDIDKCVAEIHRMQAAGADVVLTQLFYDQQDFFRFRDRYQQAGIEVPLVPGILPVTNLAQIKRITALCGAQLPAAFVQRLAEQDDPEWQFQVGVEFASAQVQALVDEEIAGLHFYVLNKSQATSQVLQRVELPHR